MPNVACPRHTPRNLEGTYLFLLPGTVDNSLSVNRTQNDNPKQGFARQSEPRTGLNKSATAELAHIRRVNQILASRSMNSIERAIRLLIICY